MFTKEPGRSGRMETGRVGPGLEKPGRENRVECPIGGGGPG
jgi:hypothetical protein